jgi:hypothetical protein
MMEPELPVPGNLWKWILAALAPGLVGLVVGMWMAMLSKNSELAVPLMIFDILVLPPIGALYVLSVAARFPRERPSGTHTLLLWLGFGALNFGLWATGCSFVPFNPH